MGIPDIRSPFKIFVGRFGISCTVNENRTFAVQCQGISGVINDSEVGCIYDSGPMVEKCKCVFNDLIMSLYTFLCGSMPIIYMIVYISGELPVTIDIARYDRDPGTHNITIIANSTTQETADNSVSFTVQGNCS